MGPFHHFLLGKYFSRRSVTNQHSVAKNKNPVCKTPGEIHIMCCNQQSFSILMKLIQDILHPLRIHWIQRSHRFVKYEQLRLHRQNIGNADLFLFPSAQIMRRTLLQIFQAEIGNCSIHPVYYLTAFQAQIHGPEGNFRPYIRRDNLAVRILEDKAYLFVQ